MDNRLEVKFPYCADHNHGMSLSDFRISLAKDKGNAMYFNILAKYIKESLQTYDQATEKRINAIVTELNDLGDSASLEQINDKIIYHLFEGWQRDYIDKQVKVSTENIELAYDNFRRDTSFFEAPRFDPKNVPEAVFDVRDFRTIEYYKNSDNFYLGKFITDDDTRKRMSRFIKDEYIENNLPIGNSRDPKSIARFREKFGNVLQGEDWKLVRIINTTVNRLRNHASVNYMNQAQIEEFEIVGISDRLQCPYCKAMQGKRFKVEKAVQRIDNVTKSEPQFVQSNSPFLVSAVSGPDQIADISSDELQDYYNIDAPPYHPHCRDRVVAVFSQTSQSAVEDDVEPEETDSGEADIPQEFKDLGLDQNLVDRLNTDEFTNREDFFRHLRSLDQDTNELEDFFDGWLSDSGTYKAYELDRKDTPKARMAHWATRNLRTPHKQVYRGIELPDIYDQRDYDEMFEKLKTFRNKNVNFGQNVTLFDEGMSGKGWDNRMMSFTSDRTVAQDFMDWNYGDDSWQVLMRVDNENGVRGFRMGHLFAEDQESFRNGGSQLETIVGGSLDYKVKDVEKYTNNAILITFEQLEPEA